MSGMLLLTWFTQQAESRSALGTLGGHTYYWASLAAQMGKHLPAMRETGVQSLARESPGEEMAPHSSTLAWKIPWMEEPGKLQSMGSQRVGHD